MKCIFYCSIILCSLLSCRPKSIDIKVKPEPPKLVVFTQVIPDNIMIVTLTKTFSPLEGNTSADLANLLVTGASVQIKSNGQIFICSEVNPGVYISYATSSFTAGQVYDLIAISGSDTVTATSTMLSKVDFTSILPSVEKLAVDTNVYLDFSFNDLPSISNWYLINVYKKGSTSSGLDVSNYFQNGSNSLSKSIIISDKEFNGTYQSKIELDDLKWNDSMVVTLSNINEQYFNYLGFRLDKGGVFSQLNIEPMSYPTNIVNGYGFFNTFFPDIRFFDLKEY